MSWFTQTTLDREAGGEVPATRQVGYGKRESEAAVQAATDAARTLIRTGVLGDGPFTVTLHGHANPDHAGGDHGDGQSWANDFLTVAIVSQAVRGG